MHGDPAPQEGFAAGSSGPAPPLLAGELHEAPGVACRRRGPPLPWLSPGLGAEALGSPDSCTSLSRASRDPCWVYRLRHSSFQAPGSPGRQWVCISGGSRHHSPGLGLGSWASSPLPLGTVMSPPLDCCKL